MGEGTSHAPRCVLPTVHMGKERTDACICPLTSTSLKRHNASVTQTQIDGINYLTVSIYLFKILDPPLGPVATVCDPQHLDNACLRLKTSLGYTSETLPPKTYLWLLTRQL